MNASMLALIELADAAKPDATLLPRVHFEVHGPGLEPTCVAFGDFDPGENRSRAAFGQAVGKLLAAGYEVTTYRDAAA